MVRDWEVAVSACNITPKHKNRRHPERMFLWTPKKHRKFHLLVDELPEKRFAATSTTKGTRSVSNLPETGASSPGPETH
jgi:hypothetical protein